MRHAGSFKNHKIALLNDPKCQKRGFLDLGFMDRLDIAYDDRTLPGHEGSFKSLQEAFLNDPNCRKCFKS